MSDQSLTGASASMSARLLGDDEVDELVAKQERRKKGRKKNLEEEEEPES